MEFTPETLAQVAQYSAAVLGAFLAALWLALIFWTFRDFRSRSRDRLVRVLAALVVALLGPLGLVIYLILRPPRTLAEEYQHTLEEEALLSEIEERSTCPGCGSRTQSDWQICPQCHTRLHKPCSHCGRLMQLAWKVCPYCATPVPGVNADTLGL
jgi:RNA polymerase subunit RPABC4/transcription elongation factor Spt4